MKLNGMLLADCGYNDHVWICFSCCSDLLLPARASSIKMCPNQNATRVPGTQVAARSFSVSLVSKLFARSLSLSLCNRDSSRDVETGSNRIKSSYCVASSDLYRATCIRSYVITRVASPRSNIFGGDFLALAICFATDLNRVRENKAKFLASSLYCIWKLFAVI